MVARDIQLVRLTGAPVHFLHLSTAGSVELVRQAKAEGLPVTAEAAPHHMLLTHAEVAGYDPVFKVNPPLRTDDDVAAVIAGLCDGTIDAIATDHAPHAPRPRTCRSTRRRPGCSACRRALPIAWQVLSPHCSRRSGSSPSMSAQPAAIAGLTVTDARPGRPQRARRPDRGGRDGQPVRLRPDGVDRGGPGAPGQPQPQHALRRSDLHRRGAPHDPAGRAGRDRRGGPAMTRSDSACDAGSGRRRCLVTADGAVFAGEAAGALGPGGHRGAGVQHRHERLPGGHHRIPPTPDRSWPSPAPTSATTAPTPRTTRPRGPHCRGIVVRDLTVTPPTGGPPRDWRAFSSATASRPSPGSTPGA